MYEYNTQRVKGKEAVGVQKDRDKGRGRGKLSKFYTGIVLGG
jgi:hypothetical protein